MTQFDPNNILTVAMTITDQEDADQYLASYISYIQNDIDNDPNRINDNAEDIAKSNLGYFAGYYNNETRERVERLFLAQHPFFGSVKNNITPEQAFRMGQNLAIKHSRKTKIDKINKSQ